ncbi:MAG: hypothetical protein RL154_916 [Pseudomonadota bacterium]|jgi:diadenosine tetraphosphate (Ap4A) HIT family hydrolase
MEIIWENEILYLLQEQNELPWVKIFLKSEKKELTDCTQIEQNEIFTTALRVESAMREYYNPAKINHASFGNILPKVHWHIQARFNNDAYFPESLWGVKQQDAKLNLPPFDGFIKLLKKKLNAR